MLGQVHLPKLDPLECFEIQKKQKEIVEILNNECKSMVSRGGGVKSVALRELIN